MNEAEKWRSYQSDKKMEWYRSLSVVTYLKIKKGGNLEIIWRIKILARAVTSFDKERSFGWNFDV